MTIINNILNELGLIGDCVQWIIRLINGMQHPEILLILIFVGFLVVMFGNGIITRKTPYKY